MKRYNVLWLEDEPEKNPVFIDRAEFDGIDLIHVYTVMDFKKVLSEKVKILDAVVLDAKGVLESLEEKPSLVALKKALSFINENNHIKLLPHFILSAHLGQDENRSAREFLEDEIIYTKSEDENKLIPDLKKAADQQKNTQIKHNNEAFFNAIKSYDIEAQNLFIDILSSLHVETSRLDEKLYFTHIRIVLEQMFRKANRIGLLHDFCIDKGKVNLSDSSLFLSGRKTKHSKDASASISHFPNIISQSVFNILTITGAASHTTDPDYENNINIQEYRKSIKTPYLLYNLTFQLMDILIWFDEYVKQKPDQEENKKLWVKIDEPEQIDNNAVWIEGKFISVNDAKWGTFQPSNGSEKISIHPLTISKFELNKGDDLKVITELKGLKTHIINVEKLIIVS